MAEPMLKLSGVDKSFGDLQVLRGIDLEVDRGEVVCVLGPSGSGKSTLLRCINCSSRPMRARSTSRAPTSARGQAPGKARRAGTSTSSAGGLAWSSSSSTSSRTRARSRTSMLAQRTVLKRGAAEAQDQVRGPPEEGRPRRQARRVPGAALGRPAAAGGDRAGAGDGPPRDALRRGHQRPRPGADQGGARRDARAGGGGDDDGGGDPRDGLRPGRRQLGRSSWTRGWSSSAECRRPCSTIPRRSAPSASSG